MQLTKEQELAYLNTLSDDELDAWAGGQMTAEGIRLVRAKLWVPPFGNPITAEMLAEAGIE